MLHEVFTKTRREDVDLPHTKRLNSSFYRRKDNNGAIRRGDLTEGFALRVGGREGERGDLYLEFCEL